MDVPSHLTPFQEYQCCLESRKRHWRKGKVLTWLLISDLDKTFCKQDRTSSQTISLIIESSCYITKQGLTKLKLRLVMIFCAKFIPPPTTALAQVLLENMHSGLQIVCITLFWPKKRLFLAIWCSFDTSSLTYLNFFFLIIELFTKGFPAMRFIGPGEPKPQRKCRKCLRSLHLRK